MMLCLTVFFRCLLRRFFYAISSGFFFQLKLNELHYFAGLRIYIWCCWSHQRRQFSGFRCCYIAAALIWIAMIITHSVCLCVQSNKNVCILSLCLFLRTKNSIHTTRERCILPFRTQMMNKRCKKCNDMFLYLVFYSWKTIALIRLKRNVLEFFFVPVAFNFIRDTIYIWMSLGKR